MASISDAAIVALSGYIALDWLRDWGEGQVESLRKGLVPSSSDILGGLGTIVPGGGPSPAETTLDTLTAQLRAARDSLPVTQDVDITQDVQREVNKALQAQSAATGQAWQELYFDANPELATQRFSEESGAKFLATIREQFRAGEPVDPTKAVDREQIQRENAMRLDSQFVGPPAPSRTEPEPEIPLFLRMAKETPKEGFSSLETPSEVARPNHTLMSSSSARGMSGTSVNVFGVARSESPVSSAPAASSHELTTSRPGTQADWASIIRGHQIS